MFDERVVEKFVKVTLAGVFAAGVLTGFLIKLTAK